eukprot:6374411-Prymnesium_polylepis.1
MVPVCPCETRGGGKGGKGTKEHPCEHHHCAHPLFRFGKRRAATKRPRARAEDDETFEDDEAEQFDEGEEEGEEEED